MEFSATVDAYLAGRSVGVAPLVFMDFVEAPRRWWAGFGTLPTLDGNSWQGTGSLITIDGLQEDVGTVATPMTFTLSGVDAEIVTLARNASSRVKGRRVVVYLQFFDITSDNAGVAPWAPLDQPDAIKVGVMDQMRVIAEGPSSRSIIVTAEGLWTGRNRPSFGLYTDRDQKARFPGDRGLEQVSDLVNKTIRWPIF
jgi:hypothetical protein